MTADVYAGDQDLQAGARPARPIGAATFNVIADADADVILRVSVALNLLNIAPRVFHMECGPDGTAAVRALVDCAESQAQLIARKLQQITSVRDVVLDYAPAR